MSYLLIRLWPLWLALLTGVAGYATGWEFRDRSADIAQLRTDKQSLTDALAYTNRTLEAERGKAQALAQIATDYEAEKRAIETAAERTVADLRSGNVRLHQRWQAAIATSELSRAVASAAEPDGSAADRQESAGRIIAAADQCDAQVRGLQQVIEADRR